MITPTPPILPRLKQVQLLQKLAQEAGGRHLARLSMLSVLGTLLELAGLGLAITLLLGSRAGAAPPLPLPRAINLPLPAGLGLLVGVVLLRGLLQARVAISQERLRSGFTDQLRQQLLHQVFAASSAQLDQLGRGDLLGLLMADINRTVLSLDQAVRLLQACAALTIYLVGVLLVGRAAALPLLLALLATAAAALVQRSGSWQLGRIQSRLNASLQRTVGDGLHGLKAVRAAAAEPWLLARFARETAETRWLLQEQVRRRSGYNAWRDTLVVAVVGFWMFSQGESLTAELLATTLLLAYRAGTSLSAVVQAQRLCLGSLPGYEALCLRRLQLIPPQPLSSGRSVPNDARQELGQKPWSLLQWQAAPSADSAERSLTLLPGHLVAITGPSGSGKTTTLDRVCGLLAEDQSQWVVECDAQRWQLCGPAGARQLHQLIAYAPQDAVLLEASLRDNLLLGREQSEEAVETWLQRLGLGHLLLREGGLDAPMHLAQDPFSGGEIHRLGLLRAWLRDRPVEVLDEPTAFLDSTAAEQVRNVIRERVRERLVLVSTHDPELIHQADQVIQLEPADGATDVRLNRAGITETPNP
ncbi:MAG: ATP-binding cassette domain-containing protein [Cyanobacteriota bacterium]|nr:ATP-binding cassette domain-containing protein [Cyanobacteriota bacterium]